MSRIARAQTPYTIEPGAPFAIPMSLTSPSGAGQDITGGRITAVLQCGPGGERSGSLRVSPGAPVDGKFVVSDTGDLTRGLPVSIPNGKIIVTVTDARGMPRKFVLPVVGDAP